MEDVPLEVLVGRAWVWEYGGEGGIDAEALAAAGIPEGTERLLIRTSNSQLWQRRGFQAEFVYLKPEAARWLVGRGVRLVGFDYLSVEEFGAKTATTHLTLLGAGVVILEGLDLAGIAEGEYTLVCLPMKIKDGDGAPARAVLIED
jgi:arylformamidase